MRKIVNQPILSIGDRQSSGVAVSVNHVERAYRAWTILTKRAKDRRPITYGDLAALLDIHHRPVRYVLGVIQDYCLEERLPPLTILVINKKGVPGAGFIAHDFGALEEGMELVYDFPWASWKNPFQFAKDGQTYQSLIKTLVTDPDNSEIIYKKVKARGVQQVIFREALLKAYSKTCAFTGITFYNSLEAAHIVPWAECGPSERLDVRNGILLNSLHHKLFDKGFLTVRTDYRIVFCDPKETDGPYSKYDSLVSTELHGMHMNIPNKINNRPLAEFLGRHHQKHDFDAKDLALV